MTTYYINRFYTIVIISAIFIFASAFMPNVFWSSIMLLIGWSIGFIGAFWIFQEKKNNKVLL